MKYIRSFILLCFLISYSIFFGQTVITDNDKVKITVNKKTETSKGISVEAIWEYKQIQKLPSGDEYVKASRTSIYNLNKKIKAEKSYLIRSTKGNLNGMDVLRDEDLVWEKIIPGSPEGILLEYLGNPEYFMKKKESENKNKVPSDNPNVNLNHTLDNSNSREIIKESSVVQLPSITSDRINVIEEILDDNPYIEEVLEEEMIFTAVEKTAEFPGGQAGLMKFIASNLRYPESAQQNNTQGRVVVKFIVEKDGSISNPEISRSVDNELDREALRIVNKMPNWIPAQSNGVPVRSYFNLPINFKLQLN